MLANCIIAQSGGPTAVINASLVGIYEECLKTSIYKNIYAGLNGIEGILEKRILNLSHTSREVINTLMYTPSSGLGSCRHKMPSYEENSAEYEQFFQILKELSIEAFFYIGGNDSMDTVDKLSRYAQVHQIPIKIIGIPKTIDNDLPGMDHTPGFGSAVKLISTIALETYLDFNVYHNEGVFLLETMGRDTGWLASSGAIASVQDKCVVDFIYLPERPFIIDSFLEDVQNRLSTSRSVYIVVSEGIKDQNGKFLTEQARSQDDEFQHAQLGGVSSHLKHLLLENDITRRVKTLELGIIQRSAMHCASQRDLQEAYEVGRAAVQKSRGDISGYITAIHRLHNAPYASEIRLVKTTEVANKIKYFPTEWINERGNHVTEDAKRYLLPLIKGEPSKIIENCIPKYVALS